MRSFKIEYATLALLAIGLFATNPSKDEYLVWVGQNITKPGDGGEAVLFSLIGSPLVSAVTRRDDFALFSIYETQINSGTKFTAVGIFHHFVPMSQPNTQWVPGSRHVSSSHVIAAQETGKWKPEDGYTWVVPPPNGGDFRVAWVPGRRSTLHSHVVAADAESRWLPEDGYDWVIEPPPPGDFHVKWVSGRPSNLHSHVIAANVEGRWLPENGYAWVANPPAAGDFRTRPNYPAVAVNRNISSDDYCPGMYPDAPGDLAACEERRKGAVAEDATRALGDKNAWHERVVESTLPTCSKDFEDRWGRWHSEGWQTKPMPSTPACILQGATGSYKCDGNGCCRIGSAC